MTEEFDALQGLDLSQALVLVAGLLALGIALEVLLRLAERWAVSKNRRLAGVILHALRWQPLFWSALLVAGMLLANLSDISAERQLGTDILWGLLLISLTIVSVRIFTGWVKMLTAKRQLASVSVLGYLINGVAIIIVVAVVLWLLDVPVPLLLLTTLGSTIGLSLALRNSLSNLFAGVVLTASSRLVPGDFVRLADGEEGCIVDIEWDITTIRQRRNSLIIVPNSVMTAAQIINYDQPEPEIRVQVEVGVSYDSDLEEVERVTVEVAGSVMREVSGGVPSYSPNIRYHTFDESNIGFEVNMQCQRWNDQFRVRHEFIKRLHQRYREEGVVISYPIRTLNTLPGEPLAMVVDNALSDSAPAGDAPAMATG